MPAGLGFVHEGTVEASFDLEILLDRCHVIQPRELPEIVNMYHRQLAKSINFTFVQWEYQAIRPAEKWEWDSIGEDDNDFHIYLRVQLSNPYQQLKTRAISKNGKSYEIHVFYSKLDSKIGHCAMTQRMIEMKVVGEF